MFDTGWKCYIYGLIKHFSAKVWNISEPNGFWSTAHVQIVEANAVGSSVVYKEHTQIRHTISTLYFVWRSFNGEIL